MSSYVDADKVLKELCLNHKDVIYIDKNECAKRIEKIPSIDIVRCKECKFWERLNYEAPKEGWCDDQMPYSDGRWVDADDFCSYGERREP